ncbi:RNA polymerase subunit sigma [Tsukamurella ocularis]|uniref:RNA polymerase subunit sigma n=1 Tax=Tsukamurella ocularis TaxID=1970234 RepID=UPI0039F021B0
MKRSGVDFGHTVRAAQCGDRRAVRDVLDSVRPSVVRYCRARVSASGGRADRLAHAVCRRVLGELPGYQPRDGDFAAFVYRIAAHTVTRAEAAAPSPVGSPVQELSVRHREILILRIAVGLSAEEAASALGCTVAAIRLGQHHALAELRERGGGGGAVR